MRHGFFDDIEPAADHAKAHDNGEAHYVVQVVDKYYVYPEHSVTYGDYMDDFPDFDESDINIVFSSYYNH